MIQLTKKECEIILALIRFVYQQGGVRSAEQADDLKALKEKLSQPDANEAKRE